MGFDKSKWIEEELGCPWDCSEYQLFEYDYFLKEARVETKTHVYLLYNDKWTREKLP